MSILWTSVGSMGVYAPVVETVVAAEGGVEKPGVCETVEKALAGRVGSDITRFDGWGIFFSRLKRRDWVLSSHVTRAFGSRNTAVSSLAWIGSRCSDFGVFIRRRSDLILHIVRKRAS